MVRKGKGKWLSQGSGLGAGSGAAPGGVMHDGGIRHQVQVFPQMLFLHPSGRLKPSASPAGAVRSARPQRRPLYVINPIGKRQPYGVAAGPYGTPHVDLPPWHGHIHRPVQPDAYGHFDHIPVGTPEFAEAHVFAIIRLVLDVWERYFGRPISWHFARDFARLEVAMLPDFDNAHVGYGFMEVGANHNPDGTLVDFALNFDVVAHELGHLIIYGTLGVPNKATEQGVFGFRKPRPTQRLQSPPCISVMVGHLLEDARGNLYTTTSWTASPNCRRPRRSAWPAIR